MNVIKNYQQILTKIQKHCKEINRNPSEITLLPVSKTKPASDIQKLYDFGVRDFGENKVQELVEKAQQLPKDIRWHLIGSLQTNKVKYIADFIHLIHSVDRRSLIDEIEKCGMKVNRKIPILIQMRVAQEETKHGCNPEECESLLDYALSKEHIDVKGMMTIATFTDDKKILDDEYHIFFKNIPNKIKQDKTSIFSAGMTGDYLQAITQGATLVRVGTAIFGERQYT